MEALERICQNVRRHLSSFQVPAVPSGDIINRTLSKINVKPFTKDNVLYYYIPMQGLVSYSALSVNVMNPHIMIRLFPKRDITNILLLSAGSGAGLWLWSRPHMAAVTPARRFSWVFLGSTMWSLGSILLWAILRSSIGRSPVMGTALGIISGAALTHAAMDYFHYIELMFCGEMHLQDEHLYEPHSDEEKYDIDL